MEFIEGVYTDYEKLKESAKLWELDFNLLSNMDFKAYLTLANFNNFQIAHIKLDGNLFKQGFTPRNYRTISFPLDLNSSFNWLNEKYNTGDLLIFPKNSTIDAQSKEIFDMITISIEESYLEEKIKEFNSNKINSYFDGDKKKINISIRRIVELQKLALEFISGCRELHNQNIDEGELDFRNDFETMFNRILKALDNSIYIEEKTIIRKRDTAIYNAIEYIQDNTDIMPSKKELSSIGMVSARTLEYAFNEKFSATTKEFILSSKLNKIKEVLINSEVENTVIKDIAYDYGFWHLGQFSSYYKKKFGETPSQTLKRSPR